MGQFRGLDVALAARPARASRPARHDDRRRPCFDRQDRHPARPARLEPYRQYWCEETHSSDDYWGYAKLSAEAPRSPRAEEEEDAADFIR